MAYIEEPKLIREIFESEYPVMDKRVQALPRAQALYSNNFEDQTDYVQDIIRTRQKEKYKKNDEREGGNIISTPPLVCIAKRIHPVFVCCVEVKVSKKWLSPR